MIRLTWIVVAVGAMGLASQAANLSIAKGGKADTVIVVGADAMPAEKTAAGELRDYLGKVTGARFDVRSEGDVAEDAAQIVVGPCSRAKRLCPKIDWAALGRDGIVIKTVGNKLVLAGGRPRGTLYAVYTFLEDVVGLRWWTSSETDVPRRPTLNVQALDVTHTPKLRYREAFYRDVTRHPIFAARLKCNGHFEGIPPSHGGHYSVLGWCHTFYSLVPPDKHFAQHPEWYSEIEGKRTADRAQLCLTNDAMRAELTRAALAVIRKSPDAGIVEISQNDWHGQCQCAKCKAVEAEEGSSAGPLIRFLNVVATDVGKEFPDVLVQTLAYQYTRKPPSKARPRPNVVIRLCSIECDFGHPLDSDANAKFRDDIKGWSAIAPTLAIWNYVTNFRNYLLVHPNMRSLAADLRFFVKHGAVSVFEQGDNGSSIGDFVRLRAWVLGHLMWDPSRDQNTLIRDFMTGYYGAAGPHLSAYLDLVHDALEKRGVQLRCYNTDTTYLTPDDIARAKGLFDRAAKAVADDPVLTRRVRRERMPLDLVCLLRRPSQVVAARLASKRAPGLADPIKERDEFIRLAKEFEVGQYREGRPFSQFEEHLKRLFRSPAPPPERCKGLNDDRWLDVQDNLFHLHRVGSWSTMVDDAAASDGKAARMGGEHTQWAVQWHVKPEIPGLTVKWRCFVRVRCEAKAKTGTAFTLGLRDKRQKRGVAQQAVSIERVLDGAYHDYDLGVHELTPDLYFWVAPPGNAQTVKAVYVDRIYLIRE